MRIRADKWRIIAVPLLCGLLLSCGMGTRIRSLAGDDLDVQVAISAHANQDSPVAVELVLVYAPRMMDFLMELSAGQWFAQKAQIKKDYLKGEDFDAWYWEWVPGQKIPEQKLPLEASAVGGVVFASYRTPGQHRVRFDPITDMRIDLKKAEFTVTPLD